MKAVLSIIGRRLLVLIGTLLVISLVIFAALEVNVENVAVKVLGQFSTQEQRNLWLGENGYFRPFHVRYLDWLAHAVRGDFGDSTRFGEPVLGILLPRLGFTAILGGIAMLLIVVFALVLGVLAGMRQGAIADRIISFFTIVTTSVPEFATAVFFSAIFVYWLKWLPGTSSMINGLTPIEFVLPVMVMFFYSMGYIARITRASMVEVMESHYVRTAFMKGVPFHKVILKHALRNALVAPVTVILLLVPFMLSGVIVVETFFAYKGFGFLLVEASLNDDIFIIQACAMVSVVVVVVTQLLSDLAYMWLNPRITFGDEGEA